jgi:hypothetical protein
MKYSSLFHFYALLSSVAVGFYMFTQKEMVAAALQDA